jgi:signal transduction histidine kinase
LGAGTAGATAVGVQVLASETDLLLVVSDNGRGLPADRRESGLANLRQRAALAGGTMTLEPGPKGVGLVLAWEAPLSGEAPAPS